MTTFTAEMDPTLGIEPKPTVGTLLNWMLADRARFREVLADPDDQERVLPRLLGIATSSLFLYGLVMWVVVAATGTELPFMTGAAGGRPGNLSFAFAYSLGIVGAVGICLPSFYFFALQCGFRPTLRNIVVAVAGGQALTSIFLIGILPIFAALILGVERLGGNSEALAVWTKLGLLLPLVAGLVGAAELHEWFTGLAVTLPDDARARREGVVSFLGLWSTALYVVVAPVLVYQLLMTFGRVGF
jgi:hypothetical protein